MQVILTQDVKKLGKKYQAVKVKDGYWRNFLGPKGLAVAASKANLEKLKKAEAHIAMLRASERSEAEQVVAALAGKKVTIQAKASKEGKLFGSVKAEDIVRSIHEQFTLSFERDQIMLAKPIRELGEFMVMIRPEKDVEGKLGVVVEAEKT